MNTLKIALLVLLMGCSSQNERFQNREPFADKSLLDIIKWRLSTKKESWPEWIESEQYNIPHERSEELSYTVINHATVLIQWYGLNILTDPVFSKRVSPVSWLGPQRVRLPGVRFEDLPPIDIVLISHNHYDHLDLETLKRLKLKSNPLIVVGLRNGELLESEGLDHYRELDWWQDFERGGLSFSFVPAQHWSARGLFDKRMTLWGGFSIKERAKGAKHVYFAGDTGYGRFFKEIKEKRGRVDVAFLPIGAYEPRWFMKDQHMNPREAIQAHHDLESVYSVGIHFETFQLTDEGVYTPRKTLEHLKEEKELKGEFHAPTFGVTVRPQLF
jgi:L-ascorbate metabolism protein UlaG (beta-lactamase superfamily)